MICAFPNKNIQWHVANLQSLTVAGAVQELYLVMTKNAPISQFHLVAEKQSRHLSTYQSLYWI
jgi:hypothetical protein